MTEIKFNRHDKDVFITHGTDDAGLHIKLRHGVRGLTHDEAGQAPLTATLRFAQPVDLLDFADTCLSLAAAGFKGMDEARLSDAVEGLRSLWPIANAHSASMRVMWRGFGQVWSGIKTGRVTKDGYTQVKLGPGSEGWGQEGDGTGWVLTSILVPASEPMVTSNPQ